jgi:hypothetical protein
MVGFTKNYSAKLNSINRVIETEDEEIVEDDVYLFGIEYAALWRINVSDEGAYDWVKNRLRHHISNYQIKVDGSTRQMSKWYQLPENSIEMINGVISEVCPNRFWRYEIDDEGNLDTGNENDLCDDD